MLLITREKILDQAKRTVVEMATVAPAFAAVLALTGTSGCHAPAYQAAADQTNANSRWLQNATQKEKEEYVQRLIREGKVTDARRRPVAAPDATNAPPPPPPAKPDQHAKEIEKRDSAPLDKEKFALGMDLIKRQVGYEVMTDREKNAFMYAVANMDYATWEGLDQNPIASKPIHVSKGDICTEGTYRDVVTWEPQRLPNVRGVSGEIQVSCKHPRIFDSYPGKDKLVYTALDDFWNWAALYNRKNILNAKAIEVNRKQEPIQDDPKESIITFILQDGRNTKNRCTIYTLYGLKEWPSRPGELLHTMKGKMSFCFQ